MNAFVGHQLPFATDHAGNALHQRNIETSGAILGIELEGRVGKRRSPPAKPKPLWRRSP